MTRGQQTEAMWDQTIAVLSQPPLDVLDGQLPAFELADIGVDEAALVTPAKKAAPATEQLDLFAI